jgi:hypothetical protein
VKTQGRPPRVITLDGDAASHRAVRELPEENGLWKDTKLKSQLGDGVIERAIAARALPILRPRLARPTRTHA